MATRPSLPDARAHTAQAAALMHGFAERTGLTSDRAGPRYLWTDAFAVCNFLGLQRATGEARYGRLALALIDRVHRTLGRHRPDDARRGWLSGLEGAEAEAHPTRAGLRIGKELPERKPGEPFDELLEWDRDGQYFHYLTRWMHALDQASRASGRAELGRQARELARASMAFVHQPPGSARPRMHWKMSIDLTRPLVRAMSPHDPLDGHVTFAALGGLGEEAKTLASMIDREDLATADPLGLGGLLADADRIDQLARKGAFPDAGLRDAILRAALAGLQRYADRGELDLPASDRLAFRELGLAIGLAAASAMQQRQRRPASAETRALLDQLARYQPLRDRIVAFWVEPSHRRSRSFTEHLDIDEVMLATALAPEGFLDLGSG
jgi:hypothetical protein